MKIINTTQNTVLADKARVADTAIKRIKGLIGHKELKAGEALVLRPCNSMHTFFMRFAIDVLFVDKHNRIIKILPQLKPFRLAPVYFKAVLVIELPPHTIQTTATQENDILLLE